VQVLRVQPEVGVALDEGRTELEHVDAGAARARGELLVDLVRDPAVSVAHGHRDHDRPEQDASRASGSRGCQQGGVDSQAGRMAGPHAGRVPADVRARTELPPQPIGDEIDATQALAHRFQPGRSTRLQQRPQPRVSDTGA
jgi:hypothetical protein